MFWSSPQVEFVYCYAVERHRKHICVKTNLSLDYFCRLLLSSVSKQMDKHEVCVQPRACAPPRLSRSASRYLESCFGLQTLLARST